MDCVTFVFVQLILMYNCGRMDATKKNIEQDLHSERAQGPDDLFKEYPPEIQPDSRTLIPGPPPIRYVSLDKFQKVTGAQFLHVSNVNKTF